MKKLLMLLTFFGCLFLGLTTVDAATKAIDVDLRNIQTNTLIVGERIYEMNKYPVGIFEIVEAAVEYANNNQGEMAPIYYYLGGKNFETRYLVEYKGSATSLEPTARVEIKDVYPEGIMAATSINNGPAYNYVEKVVEKEIALAAGKLNEEAGDFGFYSIKYDAATNTGIFTIDDLSKKLSDYQESAVISYFLSVAKYAESITYKLDGEDVTVLTKDLDVDAVIEIAYAILSELATEGKGLSYESVANRSASAMIKFVYDGFEYNEPFTLAFVYNAEEDKDIELDKYAKKLNETAEDRGFYGITYNKETNTGTFKIANPELKLADYQDSGIIGYFLTFIQGAESITYKIAGVDKTVYTKDLDAEAVLEIAYALLADLATEGQGLTYGSVAEKSASAKVVYNVNGERTESTYTVAFEYIAAVKDQKLSTYAETLNETANDRGFESIKYNAETKTGVFAIKDLGRSLAEYQDSGIVGYFLEFIQGAESITYTIGGVEKTVYTKDLDAEAVIDIAYALLSDLAVEGKGLTYGAVAERSASAKVVYISNGQTVETIYTVAFKYIETAKDKELDSYAKALNDKADDGFASVTYDADTKTGTFVVEDEDAMLADYQSSGIVGYFLTFVKDAESITYTIGGVEKTVLTANLDTDAVVEIAYALLSDMAGDAEVLNYGAVVGKEASAKVVYISNEKEVEVTYTVAFE